MRGLYAIVDVASLRQRGYDPVRFARALAAARPAALQLRAKELSPRETLALLRGIGPACRLAGVPLFANDRVDLAILAGCDGVHVGQDDLPVEVVRRMAPGLRVGVSTHDLAQLGAALDGRPDYVAFGPVFSTRSKANPDPLVGLDGLTAAAARSTLPLVAIGGIDGGNAAEVARIAPCAAVIGGLLPQPGDDDAAITARARALHAALSWGTPPSARGGDSRLSET